MNPPTVLFAHAHRHALAALFVFVSIALIGCGADVSRVEVGELSGPGDDAAAVRAAAESALRRGADPARGNAALGKAREAEGDVDGAEEAYLYALRLDAAQPAVLHDLAVLYMARGDMIEAEDALRTALDLDPSLHGSRLLLAEVLAATDRADQARVELQAVIDKRPAGMDIESLIVRMESLE